MSTKSIIKKFWIIDEKIRYGNKATINQIVTAVKNNKEMQDMKNRFLKM